MKKVLLVMIISSGFSMIAGAQSKFSLGPNAGVGTSWISNTTGSKGKLAGNVGLSLVYSAAEHFGLGLDAKYSFEGDKAEQNNVTTTFDLNYLRVPLKAIYFFNSYGNRIRPKIYAGPSFGFLMGGDTKVENNGSAISVAKSKDLFNSFDFGVTAGAGLNIRLVKSVWFNADINYLHGISDVVKNSISNDNNAHNRNVGINVGVNFGL